MSRGYNARQRSLVYSAGGSTDQSRYRSTASAADHPGVSRDLSWSQMTAFCGVVNRWNEIRSLVA
jgi:hypothetical protein